MFHSLKRLRSGFTMVELLIVISIIATISIVAYASTQAITTNKHNTKRIADITALADAVEAQYLQTKSIPDPTANRQYYDEHGGYEHSASGSYGVTSFFSEDILGKNSLSHHPRDPDTDSYYAYGKLLKYGNEYQIGGVLRVDGTPTAYIRGTYTRTELDSLIKGYNTNLFAKDGDTNTLPYNPYKKEVTAFVVESSGSVTITPGKALTAPLTAGDTLTVSAGGLALLKVSDGTELIVGSTTVESKFSLSSMELKDDSGLLTKVRGMLATGEVVAKAPKLRDVNGDRSDLEIETGNAVAAVRGTIFAVQAPVIATDKPTFTLIAGSLKMSEVAAAGPIVVSGSGAVSDIITVPEGQPPVTVVVNAGTAVSTAVTNSADPKIESIIDRVETSTSVENALVTPADISFAPSASANASSGSVTLTNIAGIDTVKVNGVTKPVSAAGTGTTVDFQVDATGKYQFQYCKTGFGAQKCSRPFEVKIPEPKSGTKVPLSNLEPKTKEKDATGALVAKYLSGSTANTDANSTVLPGGDLLASAGQVQVRPGFCDKTKFEYFACVDFTKSGGYDMRLRANNEETYLFNPNWGTSTMSSTGGLYIPSGSNSYLKYELSTNGSYTMEVGVKGADLIRIANDSSTKRYYLIDGGSSYGQIQLYMKSGKFTLSTNGGWAEHWQPIEKRPEDAFPIQLAANKDYIIRLVTTNGYNSSTVVVWIAEEGETGSPIVYATAGTNINTNGVLLGSTQNNMSAAVQGQWSGTLRFFRLINRSN